MFNQENEGASQPAKKIQYHQDKIDAEHLYLSENLADVIFSFGSDGDTITRVPAHKVLLAMNSNVFEKMFYEESMANGDIAIADVSAAAFQEFLQFFYRSDINLTSSRMAAIMYLGKKYNVAECMEGCVEILRDGLTSENVCTILSFALLYDYTQLVKACEKRILVNTMAVFSSADFRTCSKEVLAFILRMKLLSCSEVEVFEAAMKWVCVKSKKRISSKALVQRYLGELYTEFRFASMTTQEFCALEKKYTDVLSNDFKTIVQMIAQPGKLCEQFNTAPRQIKWNDGAVLQCNDNRSDTHRFVLDSEEKTIFSANEPVLLGSFVCQKIMFGECSPRDIRTVLLAEVEIIETRTLDEADMANVLSHLIANLESQDTMVLLPQPILIRPDFFYTICIRKLPDDHCFYSKDHLDFQALESNIEITFHKSKIAQGKTGRLISTLNFNKI